MSQAHQTSNQARERNLGKSGHPADEALGHLSRFNADIVAEGRKHPALLSIPLRYFQDALEDMRQADPDLFLARQLAEDSHLTYSPDAWVAIAIASGDYARPVMPPGEVEDYARAEDAIDESHMSSRSTYWLRLVRGLHHFTGALNRYRLVVQGDEHLLDGLFAALEKRQGYPYDEAVRLVERLDQNAPANARHFARLFGVTDEPKYRLWAEQAIARLTTPCEEQLPLLIELFRVTGWYSYLEQVVTAVQKLSLDSEDKQGYLCQLLTIAVEQYSLKLVYETGPSSRMPRSMSSAEIDQLRRRITRPHLRVKIYSALMSVRSFQHHCGLAIAAIQKMEEDETDGESYDRGQLDQAQLDLARGCAKARMFKEAREAAERISDSSMMRRIEAYCAIAKARREKREASTAGK